MLFFVALGVIVSVVLYSIGGSNQEPNDEEE